MAKTSGKPRQAKRTHPGKSGDSVPSGSQVHSPRLEVRGSEQPAGDELTLVSGIGEKLAERLHQLGIDRLSQLAEIDEHKVREIDEVLSFKGRIERENWIGQAKTLVSEAESRTPQQARHKDQGGGQPRKPSDEQQGREIREPSEMGRSRSEMLAECPPDVPLAGRRTTHAMDRAFKAHLARSTLSITPAGLAANTFNWLAHLAISPGKQLELIENAGQRYMRYLLYAGQVLTKAEPSPCFRPAAADDRFDDEEWQKPPFNLIYQWFLLNQAFWEDATTDIEGLSPDEEKSLAFVARQTLDHFSPSNYPLTNPEVLRKTIAESGLNLLRGANNAIEDAERVLTNRLPVGTSEFRVGENIAQTQGKVVYRNHLIELIQYSPRTEKVRPEPILITPAWIMKYYILDLSPHNSFVGYLVDQGFTVFMISWRNPTAEDRDLGMNDYIRLGFFHALEAVNEIVPGRKVHAMGYCIGGTLLLMAAAAMARDNDDRLATVTLLAAQSDFTEAGEIMLFVSESQVSFLESLMWDQGYLDSHQMAGAFQMLQSNDLIWSRYVRTYLMGDRQKMIDLIAWNTDSTRMPYKMHSEYLRKLFLENQLAQGRFVVGDDPVTMSDIEVPIFCVSTSEDHVAPWKSVYKLHLLADTEIRFVLANRGHNGGIVSEPGHKGREYQIMTMHEADRYILPDDWRAEAPVHEGSWWPELAEWLDERSGEPVEPPQMGAPDQGLRPLEDAPGTYVHQR